MAIKIRCREHKNYTAKKSPKASCAACLYLYNLALDVKARHHEVLEVVEKSQPNGGSNRD